MLDPKLIREHTSMIRQRLGRRNMDLAVFDAFVLLDKAWRDKTVYLDALRNERKLASPKGKPTSEQLMLLQDYSQRIKNGEAEEQTLVDQLKAAALVIPNIPDDSVPIGKNEQANHEVRQWGTPVTFDFTVKSHNELGELLGILDFEAGAKISGARFTVYKGSGAQLERALINFMLDFHTREHGYTEVLPPFLVNRDSMTGTGQLPKFEDDLYRTTADDLFLIPTAEVPVTNIHKQEILSADTLPISYVAYTPCFRREAGSYGKDTAGLIRQHQFNKVELVKFTRPEDSFSALEQLTSDAEAILKQLELPYRVVVLCSGDLGFSSTKTYDLEVWLPSQGRYREISSCSNFLDFQARRAMIRCKDDQKTCYVHTLNGSGLAVGRTFAAILENYQDSQGNVWVPRVLMPYMNGKEKL